MLTTSNTSTPSLQSFNPSFFEPSITGPKSAFAKVKPQGPSSRLLKYVQWSEDRSLDGRFDDPYLAFKALCRKHHGSRTKRGHSFHAKKLRWLWYKSDGENGPFPNLWTRPKPTPPFDQPRRKRNDELAITVRCLAGRFTKAETEAVIKAYWEHNGEGYDFMVMNVYRVMTFATAMKYTAEIREKHAQQNEAKQQAKTKNRILWALEIRGSAGATPKEIAGAIRRDVQAVKKRLQLLLRDGQVVKIRHGLYRLADV